MTNQIFRIDHNKLFLFGVIFYLITPPLIGYWSLIQDAPGMAYWHNDFQRIADDALIAYAMIISSYIISFYIGSFSIYLLQGRKSAKVGSIILRKKSRINESLLPVSIILFTYLLYLIVSNVGVLFTGYTRSYNVTLLGQVATICMIALFFVIYTSLAYVKKRYSYYTFLITLCMSITTLLSLGSRMYFLIPVTSFLVYRTNYSNQQFISPALTSRISSASKRTTLFKLLSIVSVSFLLILAVGAWRSGSSVNHNLMLFIFFAEPVFTWWSASTFLSHNFEHLNMIDYPLSYLTSFINFIPSILYEDKVSLIAELSDKHYYFAPLGAESLFVSIQGNFGWLLGGVFLFFVGFYYSLIRHMSKGNVFFAAYYIMISSVLPFQFFRDGFSVVNKQIFWNMLLLPATIIFLSNLLFKMHKARQ